MESFNGLHSAYSVARIYLFRKMATEVLRNDIVDTLYPNISRFVEANIPTVYIAYIVACRRGERMNTSMNKLDQYRNQMFLKVRSWNKPAAVLTKVVPKYFFFRKILIFC